MEDKKRIILSIVSEFHLIHEGHISVLTRILSNHYEQSTFSPSDFIEILIELEEKGLVSTSYEEKLKIRVFTIVQHIGPRLAEIFNIEVYENALSFFASCMFSICEDYFDLISTLFQNSSEKGFLQIQLDEQNLVKSTKLLLEVEWPVNYQIACLSRWYAYSGQENKLMNFYSSLLNWFRQHIKTEHSATYWINYQVLMNELIGHLIQNILYKGVIELIEEAHEKLKPIEKELINSENLKFYNNWALLMMRTGKEKESVNYLKKAETYTTGPNDNAWNFIWSSYAQLEDDPQRAILYYDKILKLSRALNDQHIEAGGLIEKAVLLQALPDTSEAEEAEEAADKCFDRAMTIYNNLGGTLNQGGKIQAILDYYLYKRDFERVEQISSEFINLIMQTGQTGAVGDLYMRMAEGCLRSQEYERSIEFLKSSLKVYSELNNEVGMASSHLVLSETYNLVESYDQAAIHGQSALELLKQTSNKWAVVKCLKELGRSLMKQGQYQAAADTFEEGFARSQQLEDIDYEVDFLDLQYHVYSSLEQEDKAVECLFDAVYIKLTAQSELDEEDLEWLTDSIVVFLEIDERLIEKLKDLLFAVASRDEFDKWVEIAREKWRIIEPE